MTGLYDVPSEDLTRELQRRVRKATASETGKMPCEVYISSVKDGVRVGQIRDPYDHTVWREYRLRDFESLTVHSLYTDIEISL